MGQNTSFCVFRYLKLQSFSIRYLYLTYLIKVGIHIYVYLYCDLCQSSTGNSGNIYTLYI